MDYKDLPEGIQGGQNDYPLAEVAEAAEAVAERGGQVFQKFTCAQCGNRLTINEPNKFYTRGECDQCHFITDITETGCNFLAVFPFTEKGKAAIDSISQKIGS
jgi:hypothetical protein